MRHVRRERVWLAWGSGWAVQAYWYPCVSLGVHVDLARLLIDVHVLVFTIAIGRAAHITGQQDRHAHSCRGFLFANDPVL